ncbi:LiaI-LiaF-like domain-containing protein [Caldalkalibacillus mannanilyticus]|uniref:LiaI-LiaF-like domain-containing protein n=1 Tax=Caldalkalibacillus mannanilyticus TaxID=1418 RepID=UPI00046992E8|nr:DUF5668 domain-containing protein [Caldalkalibacillus mannanilyticus]
MINQRLLPGFILIGLGAYFLLKQLQLPLFEELISWPLILIIVGLSFILASFMGWEKILILPGGIVFSLGFHFFALYNFSFWSHHWSLFPGAVGVGFLITFLRTRIIHFMIPATILLALPAFHFLFGGMSFLFQWWPVIPILIGVYLIFGRRSW